MQKIINIFITIIVVFLIIGCSNHKNAPQNYLTRELIIVPIELPDECLLKSYGFHLFDTLLLTVEEYGGRGISVIDIKNKKLVKRIISLGKGPNEVEHIFSFNKIDEKHFQIGDPNLRKTLTYSIDSIYSPVELRAKNTIYWRNFPIKEDERIRKLYQINDSLFTAIGNFKNAQHIFIKRDKEKSGSYNVEYKYEYPFTETMKNYLKYNIFSGDIAIAPNKKQMAYSCFNCFYYRVFSIKEAEISKTFEYIINLPDYIISPRNGRAAISEKNKGGNRSTCATNEAFYFLHDMYSDEEMGNIYSHLTKEIFKVGWDGKIQEKLILDQLIIDMSLDEIKDRMYVTYFDFESFSEKFGYFNF